MEVVTAPRTAPRAKALAALRELPPFSPTLSKLLATLANEDVFLNELAAIIEKDTVLSGHVLKLVNSALYARSGTINSVRHAVSILGTNKLRNLALSLSVARMWKQARTPAGWSQAAFNLHAVAAAVMNDLLAQRVQVRYPEGAFTAGLLHAIGKLMIAIGLPAAYSDTLKLYQESPGLSMEDAEQRVLGFSSAGLGAEALEQWRLPVEIQRAVATQSSPPPTEAPSSAEPLELGQLLFCAHEIVNRSGILIPACGYPPEGASQAEALDRLGIGAQAETVRSAFAAEFEAMRIFF